MKLGVNFLKSLFRSLALQVNKVHGIFINIVQSSWTKIHFLCWLFRKNTSCSWHWSTYSHINMGSWVFNKVFCKQNLQRPWTEGLLRPTETCDEGQTLLCVEVTWIMIWLWLSLRHGGISTKCTRRSSCSHTITCPQKAFKKGYYLNVTFRTARPSSDIFYFIIIFVPFMFHCCLTLIMSDLNFLKQQNLCIWEWMFVFLIVSWPCHYKNEVWLQLNSEICFVGNYLINNCLCWASWLRLEICGHA